MVAFNFKPAFVPSIEDGRKIQTIRKTKRCSKGQMMQLFTGMRTSACVKVAERRCVLSDYVRIGRYGLTFGNKALHPTNCDDFARLDGFKDFDEMLGWFHGQYGQTDFIGYVHRWEAPPCQQPANSQQTDPGATQKP